MAGLVLELQRDAANSAMPVSSVLRKALIVSRKLGLMEMQAWLDQELNGYSQWDNVPDYRRIRGELKVKNPYHGLQPLYIQDVDIAERIRMTRTGQAISEVEELLEAKRDMYMMPLGPEVEQRLMRMMDVPLQPMVIVPRTSLVRLVDSVRNRILEWALDLEGRGVIGEGMTFSAEEKANAQDAPASIVYQIENQTVVHGMHGSQIQQGTHGSTQSYEAGGLDDERVLALVAEIRAAVGSSSLPRETVGEVEADLATIEAQVKAPKPKRGILTEALRSTRTVLENAAGGALGNAAPMLPGLLETLRQALG
ncbi:MAG: hypothetical protein INH13_29705 [Cupriavidus sp.]|nr:hypothetical protein [Cupriavidus sp.]